MTAKWQGTIALLLLIIISYIDRVNISVMILNPDFAAHFHLNENRMLQGMLMTCFLLGYGFSALLLTPVIESKLHYRQGLLSSVVIWALVCAISPLLGSLMGMLLARIILGIAEGRCFPLKRALSAITSLPKRSASRTPSPPWGSRWGWRWAFRW